MFRTLLAVLTAFFLTLALSAEEKAPLDIKTIQGKWQAIDIEGNGQKFSPEAIKEFKVVIQGDQMYAIKSQTEDPKHKIKLDPTRSPKTIDLIPLEGARKDIPAQGIYSLEDGRLKLCVNIFGKDPTRRPKEFGTRDGDGVAFVILEREKNQ